MADSLLNLATKQMVSCLVNGNLRTLDYKLDETLSHRIFKRFYNGQSHQITPESSKEFAEKFTISKMKLDGFSFDQSDCDMVYAHNLKELDLRNLNDAYIFQKYQPGHEKFDENYIQINLEDALKRLLNPECRKILEKLTIAGMDLIWKGRGVDALSDLFPSLKCLDIREVEQRISFIPNQFKMLTKLAMNPLRLNSLTGISNLQNLEILNLSGIKFVEGAKIMELFELKKLRVLNISSVRDELSRNFQCYMECNKVLPELRLLDIMGSNINLEELRRLVETHPNLEVVSVMDTPLDSTPQLETPNRDIQLLTLENMQQCCRTLEYYLQDPIDHERVFLFCVARIHEILVSTLFSVEEYRDCVINLTLVLPRAGTRAGRFLAAHSLSLIWDENIPGLFGFSERIFVVDSLVRVVLQKKKEEEDYTLHVIIWGLLSKPEFVGIGSVMTDCICLAATKSLEMWKNVDGEVMIKCMEVLRTYMGKMSARGSIFSLFTENKMFIPHILKMIETEIAPGKGEGFFRDALKVIPTLVDLTGQFSIQIEKKCIEGLIVALIRFDENEEMQLEILDGLMEMVKRFQVSKYEKFFVEQCMPSLLSILLAKNTDRQKATVAFLVAVNLRTGESKAHNVSISDESKEKIIGDILKSIDTYQEAEGANYLDVFKWISQESESKEAVEFADWILKNRDVVEESKEGEGPSEPKRRRI